MRNFRKRNGDSYVRKGKYPVEDILRLLSETVDEKKKVIIDGISVKVGSPRLVTFKVKGITCAVCGSKATFAAVERHNYSNHDGYHINFYCEKEDGQIDQLTRDHIIPKSSNGPNTIENSQPCCHECNVIKADGNFNLNPSSKKRMYRKHFSELALLLSNYKNEKLIADTEGWVSIVDILANLREKMLGWRCIKRHFLLNNVIAKGGTNIEVNEQQTKIRVKPDPSHIKGIVEKKPPEILFKIVSYKNAEYMLNYGILPTRHAYTPLQVSPPEIKRKKKQYKKSELKAIIRVNAIAAHSGGSKFYNPNEKTWLTDGVPSEYLNLEKVL